MKTPFSIIPPDNAAAHLETNEQENYTDLNVLIAVVLLLLQDPRKDKSTINKHCNREYKRKHLTVFQ